ncbi:MAG: enoyl-CoA hydratase/isomerase family protein [Phycisphaerales bacterium]|nr:enoyl-CoA hydratase/isomerase family protein [Phycisphaerales bacterium]
MSTVETKPMADTPKKTEEPLILTSVDGHVGIVTLNRPAVLNALNPELMGLLAAQMEAWDDDPSIRVILLTGSERAWAAGADIGDMAEQSMLSMYERDQFATWERVKRVKTPIVAAVSGWALGGGCELMMHCDIVIASETAQFGQPEINIGVMPGAGGTQRLTRAIGKAKAMDVILSGRFLTAHEAEQAGLVSRVVPADHFYREALKVAQLLATKPPVALRFAKEAVLKAHEMTLAEGLEYERKLFYMLFSTEDQKEGMRAFVEKRSPDFKGR